MAIPKSRAAGMTVSPHEFRLLDLPAEHRSLVEELIRGLKRALRAERLAVQVYKTELRRVLTADEFVKVQLICRAKVYGGGMPTEARPNNTTTEVRDA